MQERSPRNLSDVYSFAKQVEQLPDQIFANGIGQEPQERLSPKVAAICLLARCQSNFRAGMVLLQNQHIVEARILARCCFENLFVAAALGQNGKEFIKLLEADHQSSQKSRGEFLLQHAQDGSEKEKQFRKFIKRLGKSQSKTLALTPKAIAKQGPLFKAYAYYLQLSVDAAHPTIESLMGRYFGEKQHRDRPVYVIIPKPPAGQEEIEETLFYFSEALLGVCVCAGDILGGNEALIQPVLGQYKKF